MSQQINTHNRRETFGEKCQPCGKAANCKGTVCMTFGTEMNREQDLYLKSGNG